MCIGRFHVFPRIIKLNNYWFIMISFIHFIYEKLPDGKSEIIYLDHLQKSWNDPKGPRGQGFKGSSEIHYNHRRLKA